MGGREVIDAGPGADMLTCGRLQRFSYLSQDCSVDIVYRLH
jgi:hypothetical protein